MRHANSSITMNIYTHAVTSNKRRAQQKVVEMRRSTAVKEGTACGPCDSFEIGCKSFRKNGGDDETRIRDLCRDSTKL